MFDRSLCFVMVSSTMLAVACSSSKDKPAPQRTEPKAAPSEKEKPPEPADDGKLPVARKLSCATLMPLATVHKYFPKATVHQHDSSKVRARLGLPPDTKNLRCDVAGSVPITDVRFKCGTYLSDEQIKKTLRSSGAAVIHDIGRGAGMLQAEFVVADDDTACIIGLTYLAKKYRGKLAALGRDLVGIVTPKSIGAK